jgi:hypothetical protein
LNVQLRNSNGYPGHVPIRLPRSPRRWRFGIGDGNINSTTIWTPTTGFLNQPGTLTAGYQYQPQVTSVYDVPGLLLPAPDCVQASGGAFVSAACVDKALAVQQQNFQRTAAYNAGTLKLPAATDPATGEPATPAPPAPTKTPATSPASTAAQKIADKLTGGSSSGGGSSASTPTTPVDNSTLYWIAGLAAAGFLFMAVNR